MLEKYNLKPQSELIEKYNIDIDNIDVNEDLIPIFTEVYRKGDLILYEYEDDDIGTIIPNEIISEIFPEFELDLRKYYVIEKNGETLYY